MSILSKIQGGRIGRPQKVVIYAPEGYGKSTLASQMPAPLFLDLEGSTSQLDLQRLTRENLPNVATIEAVLKEVTKSGEYKTVVIDTVDWLEQMMAAELCAEHKQPAIVCNDKGSPFSYGRGTKLLAGKMTVFLSRLDEVISGGLHVCLLAHSQVVKFEPPDAVGAYDRYELKLTKQVAAVIKEWADLLAFGNWRTQVVEKDKNDSGQKFKGVGGRDRKMYCNRTSAWDAKNRHGLGDAEEWGIETLNKALAIVPCIPKAPQPTDDPADKFKPTSAPREVAPETKAVSVDSNEDALFELARICGPVTDAATAFLLEKRHITEGQTWEHVPAEYRARILKNPAAFLKAINGKAVA